METENKTKRLLSIDALRGFDMLFIMGFSTLVALIAIAISGNPDCWLARQMGHVGWHGLAHHDTIFPLFLFVSGMTFPFSFANQVENGRSKKQILLRTIKRGLILVALGLVYSGLFDLHLAHLRFPSVLARIGLGWMGAALIFQFVPNWKARAGIGAFILIGYWLLLALCPAPDAPAGTDPFSYEGNLVGYIDRIIMPNHLYEGKFFDPEGILSTFPAIVTAMLGMFTGEFIKESKVSPGRKTLYMFIAAAALLVVGLVWSKFFPINKKLWTSTFVLVVGAYSVAMYALFYWLIDVKGWKGWTPFFKVIGMNSITVYLAMRIIDFGKISNFFFGGLAGLFPEPWSKMISTAAFTFIVWLFLLFLYKKKVFLKV
ncbi:MAG: DUF5009 domain-containing protein [Bacteroidales bacterium]|nr:DUF5009 domain-containing protein [Bacteroidales bacterium]